MESETVQMDKSGRIVVPAVYRKALGIGPGDHLLMRIEQGELVVSSWERSVRRLQQALAPWRAKADEPLVSDQLLTERREEAERS